MGLQTAVPLEKIFSQVGRRLLTLSTENKIKMVKVGRYPCAIPRRPDAVRDKGAI